MSQKRNASLAGVVERISEKGYAIDFDFTIEFNIPQLRVGSVRVFGRVESVAPRKK